MGSQKPRRARIMKKRCRSDSDRRRSARSAETITRRDSGVEGAGHSAACRERIEDVMKANPDFCCERVDRAHERVNKMLAEYLEKKDKEASEEQQPTKRARTETSQCCKELLRSTSTAGGSWRCRDGDSRGESGDQ